MVRVWGLAFGLIGMFMLTVEGYWFKSSVTAEEYVFFRNMVTVRVRDWSNG